jgi:hypothetical protein
MDRIVAGLAAIALVVASPLARPLEAQRLAAYRGGVTSAPDTAPPSAHILTPPSPRRLQTSLQYIGLTAAFGALVGAVSFSERNCPGCSLGGAMLGSMFGTGVGDRLASSALHCDRWSADARTALASFVAGGTALMIGRANGRAGEWTAMLGIPLASGYLVSGCDPR